MKNIYKRVILLCSFMLLAVSLNVSLAQVPPPQPPSNGASGNQGKGPTAPIDGGVVVSLAMVAGYGAYKLLKAMQKKRQV
jgi:hypothetical protein